MARRAILASAAVAALLLGACTSADPTVTTYDGAADGAAVAETATGLADAFERMGADLEREDAVAAIAGFPFVMAAFLAAALEAPGLRPSATLPRGIFAFCASTTSRSRTSTG